MKLSLWYVPGSTCTCLSIFVTRGMFWSFPKNLKCLIFYSSSPPLPLARNKFWTVQSLWNWIWKEGWTKWLVISRRWWEGQSTSAWQQKASTRGKRTQCFWRPWTWWPSRREVFYQFWYAFQKCTWTLFCCENCRLIVMLIVFDIAMKYKD